MASKYIIISFTLIFVGVFLNFIGLYVDFTKPMFFKALDYEIAGWMCLILGIIMFTTWTVVKQMIDLSPRQGGE